MQYNDKTACPKGAVQQSKHGYKKQQAATIKRLAYVVVLAYSTAGLADGAERS
jgi:hypothetical protein